MENLRFDDEIKSPKNKKGKPLVLALVLLIIVVIGFFATIFVLKTYIYPKHHFDIIKEQAAKNNLDPYLILSIIKTESSFKKYAISNKEAKGLMQIMDATANDINNKENVVESIDEYNIYDENVNISLGCNYFKTLVNKYNGNYYLAICAYNAGMGNVDKWIEQNIIPKNLSEYKKIKLPFNQTSKYLEKVMSSYNMYKVLYK